MLVTAGSVSCGGKHTVPCSVIGGLQTGGYPCIRVSYVFRQESTIFLRCRGKPRMLLFLSGGRNDKNAPRNWRSDLV
jgi:hypothetical protein